MKMFYVLLGIAIAALAVAFLVSLFFVATGPRM